MISREQRFYNKLQENEKTSKVSYKRCDISKQKGKSSLPLKGTHAPAGYEIKTKIKNTNTEE